MVKDKITPETEVSTTELACVLGITGRRVRQLVEDGQFEKSDGLFNLCDSVQRYINGVSGSAKSKKEAEIELVTKNSEAVIKQSKAKIAKMEASELEGQMHRSEDVAVFMDDLIFTMRSALMALPGRLAVDVASAQTAAEASDIIRKEANKIMLEISEHQYDPKAYAERVRERMNWAADMSDDDDGE